MVRGCDEAFLLFRLKLVFHDKKEKEFAKHNYSKILLFSNHKKINRPEHMYPRSCPCAVSSLYPYSD